MLHDAELLRELLDSHPAPSLTVDADMRVLFVNRAAREAFGLTDRDTQGLLLKGGGHVLHCVTAASAPGGCGGALACRSCVLRGSLEKALATNATCRARAYMQRHTPAGTVEAHFIVSAAPCRGASVRAAVMTLEDVSEIVKLTRLVPICSHCRRMRDEESRWCSVEEYFKQKADIDFSHGICPECLERHYPADDR